MDRAHPLQRYFPWIVIGGATLYFMVALWFKQYRHEQMDLTEFGRLPVQYSGRIMPLDTLARSSLLIISQKQTYYDEKDKKRYQAIKWMLDVMTNTLRSDVETRFRVDDEDVRAELGLPEQAPSHMQYRQLRGPLRNYVAKLEEKYGRKLDRSINFTPRERKVIDLYSQFLYYEGVERYSTDHKVFYIVNLEVLQLLGLERREGNRYAYSEFKHAIPDLMEQARLADAQDSRERNYYQTQVLELARKVNRHREIAGFEETLSLIPPFNMPGTNSWLSPSMARMVPGSQAAEAANRLVMMLIAYSTTNLDNASAKKQGVETFNNEVQTQHTQYAGAAPTEVKKASLEQHFNQAEPFYICTVVYLLIVVLGVVSWLLNIFDSSAWSQQVRVSAFWLLVLTCVVHTFALVARMYLMGRPPVTNLYSSAVFIGWGAVLLGIVMEKIHPYAIATVATSIIGFLTMIIAHHLASTSGDTMEVMQAVLDTNFWLATHVVIVTLGYMATLIGMVLGMIYIFGGVFTDALRGPFAQVLTRMIYGIVCFALFLSFVGTVLGGIWADQSWGRFWGWDPKENGAVMVVVWNAIILHARWGGMIKQRGMAICAVVGGMVVGWSWFGTNQLGIGLHAYGFNNTLAVGLTVVWAALLGVIGLGFLPTHHWKSFAPVLPAAEHAQKTAGRGKKRGKVAAT